MFFSWIIDKLTFQSVEVHTKQKFKLSLLIWSLSVATVLLEEHVKMQVMHIVDLIYEYQQASCVCSHNVLIGRVRWKYGIARKDEMGGIWGTHDGNKKSVPNGPKTGKEETTWETWK